MQEQKDKAINFFDVFKLPLLLVAVIWLIHFTQIIFNLDWGYYGIYPRDFSGLKGIITAPLIHGDLKHLISNSVPLLLLGGILMYFYKRVAIRSFFMIYILTGITVWIFARSVFHIGASGVVYGLVAFVFWNGIFRRSLQSIVLALVMTVLYSGYFAGILPNQEGISWESHLCGALVGIFVSYFYKEELEADEKPKEDPWANEPAKEDQPFFLNRDAFEKTKEQRLREAEGLSDWISTKTWEE